MSLEVPITKCIKKIKSKEIQQWTVSWFNNHTPEYFWEIPASSTGKYHPKYATKNQGLVKHTLVAFSTAEDLLTNIQPYSSWSNRKKDQIKSAILLHDTRKHGYPSKSKYSNASHGADLAKEIKKENPVEPFISIANLIAPHMGKWNKSYTSNKVVAPIPSTKEQRFVHMCDYIASRKYLNEPSPLFK